MRAKHFCVLTTTESRAKICCRGGPSETTFFFVLFFLVQGGERIQIPLYAGLHRPTSETPFKWCFAGVPMMAQH